MSSKWLWRRNQEIKPLLSAVGIKASRRQASKATIITLRKILQDDATVATDVHDLRRFGINCWQSSRGSYKNKPRSQSQVGSR